MGNVITYRQWTLWVGLPAHAAIDLTPEGFVATEQMEEGAKLVCEGNVSIECIQSDKEIFGYGIVLRRGSKPTLTCTDTVMDTDIDVHIARARIALEQWFLPTDYLVVEQDLANIRRIAA